jgi:hypothetical protein
VAEAKEGAASRTGPGPVAESNEGAPSSGAGPVGESNEGGAASGASEGAGPLAGIQGCYEVRGGGVRLAAWGRGGRVRVCAGVCVGVCACVRFLAFQLPIAGTSNPDLRHK